MSPTVQDMILDEVRTNRSENTDQHKTLFDKLDKLATRISFMEGKMAILGFLGGILGALAVKIL